MNKRSKVTVAGITIVSILSGILALLFLYRIFNAYVDREVARDIEINSEWTEITPSSPLKINRRFQAVAFVVDGAKRNSRDDSLALSDGTLIDPEIRVLDTDGRWHEANERAYAITNYDAANETFEVKSIYAGLNEDEYDANTAFKTIRIRSDQPFTCARLYWLNYDLK